MLPARREENAMPRGLRLIGLLALLLVAGQGNAADEAYAAGIHEWQHEHEPLYPSKRRGGWLLP